jgi:hypothetical protein
MSARYITSVMSLTRLRLDISNLLSAKKKPWHDSAGVFYLGCYSKEDRAAEKSAILTLFAPKPPKGGLNPIQNDAGLFFGMLPKEDHGISHCC